jgi:hypothetical protein
MLENPISSRRFASCGGAGDAEFKKDTGRREWPKNAHFSRQAARVCMPQVLIFLVVIS